MKTNKYLKVIPFIGMVILFTQCSLNNEKEEKHTSYQVTFDTNGGDAMEKVEIEEGNKITKPSDATFGNHKFLGWYASYDDANVFDFDSFVVNKDVTLYAKWEYNGLTFNKIENSNDYECTKSDTYVDETKAIYIPGTFNGSKVIKVSDSSFAYLASLEEVYIGEGIETLGEFVFRTCSSLKKITLPKTLTTIAKGAFVKCSLLNNVSLPENLTTMGENAFQTCSSLESIVIPEKVTVIPKNCFVQCSSLSSVKLPNNLETLSIAAFGQCSSLEKIELPLKLKTIEKQCFQESGLKSITIPGSVSIIGEQVFGKCNKLSYAKLSNSLLEIPFNFFFGCSNLKTIIFGENINTIGQSGFNGCGFETLIIPDSITTISERAFSNCDNLKLVKLPRGLISLASGVFSSTTKGYGYIESIIIPDSLVTIPESSFGYFKDVYCESTSIKSEWNTAKWYNTRSIYYYSETSNTDGSHWHYVNDVPTVWA